LIIELEDFRASLALTKDDTRSGVVACDVLRVDVDELQVFSIRSDHMGALAGSLVLSLHANMSRMSA
jgi:hypothetical protein